jgi:serine/threonine-protein kinase RsbT
MENEIRKYELAINTFEDVLLARRKAREIMDQYKFTTLDQTKFITAISELLRNVIIHAGNGTLIFRVISVSERMGVKCVITDQGPGIIDINQALTEGFSTVGSLGLGLGGAKKLSDDFVISSTPQKGTTVEIIKWK